MKLYMSFTCFRHDLSNLVCGRKQLLGFELNCWIRHRLRTPRNIYFSCAHAPKLHISDGEIEEELTFSQIPQRCDLARYSLSPSFLSRWWNYPKQEGDQEVLEAPEPVEREVALEDQAQNLKSPNTQQSLLLQLSLQWPSHKLNQVRV